MCNRYRQGNTDKLKLGAMFNARVLDDTPLPHTELFPRRQGAVVRKEAGERLLDVMRWGFPPPGASKVPVTNVRNLASPFWRSALKNPERRCLVPVTEFCEWSGERGAKQEHWFSITEQPVFAFAGIWRPTEEERAFAFLTCGYLGDPSAHIVGAIHEKACPVILHSDDHDKWLDGEVDEICALAEPFPSQLMRVA
jgi:putative SOS response-associated peptidase YedK